MSNDSEMTINFATPMNDKSKSSSDDELKHAVLRLILSRSAVCNRIIKIISADTDLSHAMIKKLDSDSVVLLDDVVDNIENCARDILVEFSKKVIE